LADKVGRKKVMIAAFAFWALVCLILITGQTMPAIIFAIIVYGLHLAAIEPVQKNLGFGAGS